MRHRPVPVTMGSPWFRSMSTQTCLFTEVRFSAGDALHPHTHDRPIMAVMLDGSFDTAIGGKRFPCTPGWSWTEPCEERHANYIGTKGARVLVMQPDPTSTTAFEFIEPLIEDILHVRDALVAVDARRVLAEMDRGDSLSALAVDALMVGMLVRVSRDGRRGRAPRRSPSWLGRIQDLLNEEFRSPPSLLQLSREAGVTPTHLCHAFREHVGTTIGRYVRSARASWAAEQLRSTDHPLSAIAAAAGYADQSHFIRECRRLLGTSPSDYRRNSRSRA
jgi:AraC family transcriptional regulator